ncbi:MAG: ABC transporter ATP-binding protein [Thermoanaerobaculia bacterium]|nr:ABC transporter ATP-binding protein [Thermoanaerobaculia bacterium]
MPPASDYAVEVRGIRKRYGRVVAVAGVDFEVRRGEIFGLIGPNGAGKTTTLECVEGIRRPDAGSIAVLGLDPHRDAARLQRRIGVQLQQAQLQKRIKVREAVRLWSALFDQPVDGDLLLSQLGLESKREAWFLHLSGGQKQRLFIALALINDPELVFLDELTTGLDPQARRAIWELVRGIRARGKTVLLTTHLMEEAERLCDRVAILDHGRIVESGTPAELVARHCPERTVTFRTDPGVDPSPFHGLAELIGLEVEAERLTLRGRGDDFLSAVIDCISAHRVPVRDFHTERANLEDVFLTVTGHSVRE